MSFIGATGQDENQENYNLLDDKIDANSSYINTLVGIPDPTHTLIYGINPLNPGLFGLVERAEVNISVLQSAEEGLTTDLSALTTQVEEIQTEVTAIQGEVTAIQGEILAVQGEITGLSGAISTIQTFEIPAIIGSLAIVSGVAGDALGKANKSLAIWDEDGNNTYNMKTGNVGIGITKGAVLNNKLEVNGNINISSGSKYKINNVDLSYNDLTNKLTAGTNIQILNNVINNLYTLPTASTSVLGGVKVDGSTITINASGIISGANTYVLPTATTSILGGVKVDGSTITINASGIISGASATPQVNSDWTQTNTSLKSFIQNKPLAGNNISFVNNTITNTITGSPTQNIIGLNTNELIVVDKPNSQKIEETFTPLTSEPSITAPAFTESIRTFTHSGGTETQTPYTITIGQNTICDILIVGGGGGGGTGHGGGGGAGQLVLIHQAILSGTYTIKVGKGGNGSTLSGTSSTMGTLTNGTKGSNSEFGNASINVIAEGGGIGVDTTLRDGGSGAGGDGHLPDGGVGGKGLKNTTIDTFSSGSVYSRGNDGGDGAYATSTNAGQGGGGGGAGSAGKTGGQLNDSAIGHGGDGLSGISEINYDFKTNFGNYGKLEADGKYWFAGGGAGGVYYLNSSVVSNGGKGGGASTPASVAYTKINGNNAVNNTGGGGAGGSAWYGNGGNGGSGIVIIKLRTIVNAAIPEGNPVTHKTLNFTYSTTPPNQYTLSVPLNGTGVIINNTALQYLQQGNYTVTVGATQSSVVISGIGQVGSDPYPSQNGSSITFKYSMLQRITSTINYKKDGLIKYVPVSGTNPSTGTWQMIDVDSQLLTQFAGNLPFTRIDGNVPLTRIEGNVSGKLPISLIDGNLPVSRIDNLPSSLGMELTGVNGVTQIKLISGIVVIQGNLYSTGINYFKYNVWHLDSDGFERFYFQQSNTTYIKGHGTTPFEFRNGANTNICTISGSGGLAVASYLQGSGAGGGFRLVRPDTWVRMKSADETTHLDFAAQNIYAYGTLDAQGITYLNNFTYVKMQSIANTGIEYVCVVGNDAQGAYYNKALYIAYGTFTGFHRCYIEDELCNDENVDIFKNEYIGRVVISTGKIKTDVSRKKEGEENEHEWYSLEGKEGITIEDALPKIQLSRIRKDKRVYGVLGDPKRGTNNKGRIIVNGCGEGAICVANTNGNIENGDYIQTSDVLGYGEKQDDDIHRNYTVAKAVMDCDFQLDSTEYECEELTNGVRVAMIACVYKAS